MKPQEYTDRFQVLEAWARQRWPQAGERVYEWSAMARPRSKPRSGLPESHGATLTVSAGLHQT